MLVLLQLSCATYYQKNSKFQGFFQQGEMQKAFDYLEKDEKAPDSNHKVLYFLDKGVVAHMLGKYELSNEYFSAADRYVEDFKVNYGWKALSMVTNPMIEPYKVEDFESVMLYFYTALNYIQLKNYEDALVEIRRLNNRILAIRDMQKKKMAYQQDAFATYLMGMVYDADNDINNAFIAYRNAYDAYENDYKKSYGIAAPQQLKDDLLRSAYENRFMDEVRYYEKQFGVEYEPTSNKGTGEVIFLWQNGLGPVKDETVITFAIVPGAGGAFTFRSEDEGLVFPFSGNSLNEEEQKNLTDLRVVRVAFPKFVERKTFYNKAYVTVDGKNYQLERAEDINAIAIQNLRDRMLRELAESLLRVALKKAASAAARAKDKDGIALALDILGAVTEKADTRNWQTLPHDIFVERIRLPEGEHTLVLNAQGPNGVVDTNHIQVHVKAGESSFVNFHSLETTTFPSQTPGFN